MSDVAKISELMLRKIIKEKLERQNKKKKDKKEFLFEHVSVLSTSLDKKILTKIIAHKLNEAAEPGGAGGEDLDLDPIEDVFDSLFISGETTTVSPTNSRSSESEKSRQSKTDTQKTKTEKTKTEKTTPKSLILKVKFINLGVVSENYKYIDCEFDGIVNPSYVNGLGTGFQIYKYTDNEKSDMIGTYLIENKEKIKEIKKNGVKIKIFLSNGNNNEISPYLVLSKSELEEDNNLKNASRELIITGNEIGDSNLYNGTVYTYMVEEEEEEQKEEIVLENKNDILKYLDDIISKSKKNINVDKRKFINYLASVGNKKSNSTGISQIDFYDNYQNMIGEANSENLSGEIRNLIKDLDSREKMVLFNLIGLSLQKNVNKYLSGQEDVGNEVNKDFINILVNAFISGKISNADIFKSDGLDLEVLQSLVMNPGSGNPKELLEKYFANIESNINKGGNYNKDGPEIEGVNKGINLSVRPYIIDLTEIYQIYSSASAEEEKSKTVVERIREKGVISDEAAAFIIIEEKEGDDKDSFVFYVHPKSNRHSESFDNVFGGYPKTMLYIDNVIVSSEGNNITLGYPKKHPSNENSFREEENMSKLFSGNIVNTSSLIKSMDDLQLVKRTLKFEDIPEEGRGAYITNNPGKSFELIYIDRLNIPLQLTEINSYDSDTLSGMLGMDKKIGRFIIDYDRIIPALDKIRQMGENDNPVENDELPSTHSKLFFMAKFNTFSKTSSASLNELDSKNKDFYNNIIDHIKDPLKNSAWTYKNPQEKREEEKRAEEERAERAAEEARKEEEEEWTYNPVGKRDPFSGGN